MPQDRTPETLPAVTAEPTRTPAVSDETAALLDDFLNGLKPSTRTGYHRDLTRLARWAGLNPTDAGSAAAFLAACNAPTGNRLLMRWRDEQLAAGLATGTVARRLSACRSVVRFARAVGLCDWSVEVKAPEVEARRDVRGPDAVEWRKVWKAAVALGDTAKGRRDRAMLALLFDCALRRSEVVSLDLASVDFDAGKVSVVRKGKREAVGLTLPAVTRHALADWVFVRGVTPGPLFVRLDRGVKGELGGFPRITDKGLWLAVRAVGRKAKLPRPLRPHGLRHSAITAALDKGVDIRDVRKFSGHAQLNTVLKYDDARDDTFGRVAKLVAGGRKP